MATGGAEVSTVGASSLALAPAPGGGSGGGGGATLAEMSRALERGALPDLKFMLRHFEDMLGKEGVTEASAARLSAFISCAPRRPPSRPPPPRPVPKPYTPS